MPYRHLGLRRLVTATFAIGLAIATVAPAAAAGPSVGWTCQFGGSDEDYALSVATDAKRNSYVAGLAANPWPGQVGRGGSDAFLLKLRPNGSVAWSRRFGSDRSDTATAVSVDRNGRIYVVGYTQAAFPRQTSRGETDVFIRKYRPDGRVIWTRQFGTDGSDRPGGLTIDRYGRIYVAGSTSGTFPGQSNRGGASDAFVRKLLPNGKTAWTRQFGTGDNDSASEVAVDRTGRIYVGGTTSGAFPRQSNAGSLDAFLRKFRPNGRTLWTRQFGTSELDRGEGLAVDKAGRIYMVGSTAGAFPRQTSSGGVDAYIRRFRPDGRTVWIRQFGTSANDAALGVAHDKFRRIYVTGNTDGTLPGLQSAGTRDAFARRYRPNGTVAWTRQFGTDRRDGAVEVAIDRSLRFYVTGFTWGTFPGTTNAGATDVFVRMYRQ